MADQGTPLQEKVAAYRDRPDDFRIHYIKSLRWIGYHVATNILDRLGALLA